MNKKVIELMFSSDDGGAENLVKSYALTVDKSVFDIAVVVIRQFKNSSVYKELLGNNAAPVSVFKHNSFIFKVVQKLNYSWYIPFKLKRLLKDADIIHIHLELLKYIAPLSVHLKGKKLFYTCHSKPQIHLGRRDENKAARKLIADNDLQMIALHEDMRKEINEMFGIDNTVVIRNGIDFDRFRNVSETREMIRNDLSIPEGAFVIGHVGRFHEVKNHTFLIDVFSEICRQRDDAFLLLVGDGTLRTSAENKLDSLGLRGKYLILSHRTDIPQLMKAMDVFVFPSLYEGIPLTLIEAQVSGLRCIVSDKVPTEAFQTELAVPMSLESTVGEWCRTVLDDSIKGIAHGNIEDYDMNKEIKRLEKLYLGESDV